MQNNRVLVGFDGSDDAAVYKLTDDIAIIDTLDFFTPMDDDPYIFGQIAACNALSDVYAMGGTPLLALNIVCFPCSIGMDVLARILQGGADKVIESGAVVTGGHSIDDDVPKFGLSVTGIVHPDRIWRNIGAQVGDVLILTKPIGTGILNNALRGGLLSEVQYRGLLLAMSTLNRYAAEAVKEAEISVHACTDITGFGLLGHLLEMTNGTVSVRLNFDSIPMIDGTREMTRMGMVPAGAYKNLDYIKDKVEYTDSVSIYELCDPQTSGGLLFAIPYEQCEPALAAINQKSVFEAKAIGRVIEKGGSEIVII